MNELIKELALESGIKYPSDGKVEKFAKLIAEHILESVRWYDIESSDIYREDSIDYIRFKITSDFDLE